MNKYRVLGGSHGERRRIFLVGSVVVSPYNLLALFPNSFEDLGEATQQEIIAAGLVPSTGGTTSRVITTPSGLERKFGFVIRNNIPGLTEIVVSGSDALGGIDVENQADLVSVSFPDLLSFDTTCQIDPNPSLTTVLFPVCIFGNNAYLD